MDPTAHLNDKTGEFEDFKNIQDAEEDKGYNKKGRDGEASRSEIKPKMTRGRTHNDEHIVGACGIILARQAILNAECQP